MKKVKNFIIGVKDEILAGLKARSRANLFWYAVLYISYIITAIISKETAITISLVGSFLFLAILIDGVEMDLLWTPLTFLFWCLIFVAIICFIIYLIFRFIYLNTIYKFNNWLNGKV